MTLQEYAETYTEKMHWSVIPCVYGDKRALVNWKPYQRRRPDLAQVRDWFRTQKNLAIITGDVSGGLLVLDFDRFDAFMTWFHETRIRTLAVRTGKGVHLYFHLTGDAPNNGKFYLNGQVAGDIRYNGGYVIAPPSLHPSGRVYAWSRAKIRRVEAVDDLHIERRRAQEASPPHVRQRAAPPSETRRAAYIRAAIDGELDKLIATQPGSRNSQLFTSALKLAKYRDTYSATELQYTLLQVAVYIGLPEPEAVKTIRSAWRYATTQI